MPKLMTVVVALGLAAFAGPTLAQDETPPPTEAPAEAEASDEAPAEEGSTAPDLEAPAPAGEPSEVPASTSQPADVEVDVDVDVESEPADAAPTPPSPPDTDATDASDIDDTERGADGIDGADTGGDALLAGAVTSEAMERRLVAYVATGVAAVALGTGITLGTLALNKYNCLSDVVACNQGLDDPIQGLTFLDQKAEVETLALLADMAYVVAAAATVVAVTGYIRGYFLTEEDAEVTP